jgi:hypothetical protein
MKVHVNFTDNIMSLHDATKWAGKGFKIELDSIDTYEVSIDPIEIDTLDKLQELIKLFGTECIIGNHRNGKDMWLEIYNDYRE